MRLVAYLLFFASVISSLSFAGVIDDILAKEKTAPTETLEALVDLGKTGQLESVKFRAQVEATRIARAHPELGQYTVLPNFKFHPTDITTHLQSPVPVVQQAALAAIRYSEPGTMNYPAFHDLLAELEDLQTYQQKTVLEALALAKLPTNNARWQHHMHKALNSKDPALVNAALNQIARAEGPWSPAIADKVVAKLGESAFHDGAYETIRGWVENKKMSPTELAAIAAKQPSNIYARQAVVRFSPANSDLRFNTLVDGFTDPHNIYGASYGDMITSEKYDTERAKKLMDIAVNHNVDAATRKKAIEILETWAERGRHDEIVALAETKIAEILPIQRDQTTPSEIEKSKSLLKLIANVSDTISARNQTLGLGGNGKPGTAGIARAMKIPDLVDTALKALSKAVPTQVATESLYEAVSDRIVDPAHTKAATSIFKRWRREGRAYPKFDNQIMWADASSFRDLPVEVRANMADAMGIHVAASNRFPPQIPHLPAMLTDESPEVVTAAQKLLAVRSGVPESFMLQMIEAALRDPKIMEQVKSRLPYWRTQPNFGMVVSRAAVDYFGESGTQRSIGHPDHAHVLNFLLNNQMDLQKQPASLRESLAWLHQEAMKNPLVETKANADALKEIAKTGALPKAVQASLVENLRLPRESTVRRESLEVLKVPAVELAPENLSVVEQMVSATRDEATQKGLLEIVNAQQKHLKNGEAVATALGLLNNVVLRSDVSTANRIAALRTLSEPGLASSLGVNELQKLGDELERNGELRDEAERIRRELAPRLQVALDAPVAINVTAAGIRVAKACRWTWDKVTKHTRNLVEDLRNGGRN